MSPSIKSLLTPKVLQRLPIVSTPVHLNSGSSSRKEDNPSAERIDRPVLVLKTSVRKLG